MTHRPALSFTLLALMLALAFALNLALGSVNIPVAQVWDILTGGDADGHTVWANIIWKSRMPQALTALVAGAALSVSGLQMQTVFRNPLADPSVLGVSAGASLGVAMVVLVSGTLGHVALSSLGLWGDAGVFAAAIAGAMAVLALIVFLSARVRGNVTLLILGVMIGYAANAIIGVLKYFSVEEDIRAYVIWGLGSFSRVSAGHVGTFVLITLVLLALALLPVKAMNILLLGTAYARNLGLNVRRARLGIILSAGTLVAVCTAYCGPIMFLGLAVPHLARGLFRTSNHRILLPATMLMGSLLALGCNLIARMPGMEGALPVNSVTALIGAPVVAWVLLRRRKDDINE